MILFTAISYDSFKKRIDEANTKFASKGTKTTSATAVGTYAYEKSMKYLYKALSSIKTDSKNPDTKNYFLALEKTGGDYSKRDSKIFSKVAAMVSFCRRYIEDKEYIAQYPELKNSTLGVYVNMFDILTSGSYTSMFKKAFSHSAEVGDMNSSVTVFKTVYISLCFAAELSTAHLSDFEISLYMGKTPDKAIMEMMTKHASFTKNVIFSVISVLGYLNSMKNPVQDINECIAKEKEMKKKTTAKEAEDLVPSVSANTKDKTSDVFVPTEVQKEAATIIKEHEDMYSGDVDSAAESKEFLGGLFATVPVLQISLWALGVTAAILIIPMLRILVYYFKAMNIDAGKELELKSEILDNNIVLLKEKLYNTKDPKERERLESIIKKQEEYVESMNEKAKSILEKKEDDAGYIVEDNISTEDERKDESENDKQFEIIL
jgi:hypothetical protein